MKRSRLLASALSLSGLVAVCGGCKSTETAVAIGDLPPAVKATLDRESAGGKVTEIEKEMKDGKTVYSADATVNGQDWDITIAADGKLISKELEKPEKK